MLSESGRLKGEGNFLEDDTKKASACVYIVNLKFTQLEELHQKYETEFGLSLAENAKIIKVSKTQNKLDKRKTVVNSSKNQQKKIMAIAKVSIMYVI